MRLTDARVVIRFSVAVVAAGMLLLAGSPRGGEASHATFTVNYNAQDLADLAPGNGACDVGLGACSLRAAIQEANVHAGSDTIHFAIGAGNPTINPGDTGLGALPPITQSVTINGNTGGATRIELNGTSAGANAVGLTIDSNGVTVRGMVINRFTGPAIKLNEEFSTIAGNFIGTNSSGTVALGNGGFGAIYVTSASRYNLIGGSAAVDRNVVSGNGTGIWLEGGYNTVSGNYIGTTASGVAALGNNKGIEVGGPENIIGGTTAGERNVISGNTGPGVHISSGTAVRNKIIGNYIGTSATGASALGNATGVFEEGLAFPNFSSDQTSIGGQLTGERNIISGNLGHGILLEDSGVGASRIANTAIMGNYIGTDATGSLDVGNGGYGIAVQGGFNNCIGGWVNPNNAFACTAVLEEDRNVISGNNQGGVLDAAGSAIITNFIGTDATGTNAIPNQGNGLDLFDQNHRVGKGGRNVVSGNTGHGIYFPLGAGEVQNSEVTRAYIGLNAAGTAAIPNGGDGIHIKTTSFVFNRGHCIGALDTVNTNVCVQQAGLANVISGNTSDGVEIAGSPYNLVYKNFIGTDATGATGVGNAGHGVHVSGAAATANSIRGNSIHANGGKGIENIGGGNGEPGHAPPSITAGSFSGASGTACSGCTIEIFSNDAEDEGRVHHGTVTADGGGNWSFTGAISGPKLTATATNAAGSTSEFGSFLGTPQPGPDYTVNSTGPEDDGGCHEGFGDCTLREAINAANSHPTPSMVDLAVGPTFTLMQADNGVNGLPVITTHVRVNGHDATLTRDTAGPRFRLFEVSGTGDLILEDLTLTQGHPPDGTGGGGGAILATGGVVTVVRSKVTGNRAGAGVTNVSGGHGNHGGAILMNGGFLVVDSSTVNGNFAGNGALGTGVGGAFHGGNGGNGGGIAAFGATVFVVGSTINTNFAGFGGFNTGEFGGGGQGGQGGGIYINNASNANIGNATIVANTAGAGGGGGQFSGTGGNGGGIRTQSLGGLTLSHVTFSNNNAGTGGPGAANGTGGGINDSPGAGIVVKNTLMVAGTVGANCAAVINSGSGGNISSDSSCGTTYFVQRTPAQINLAAALANNGGPTLTLALTPPSAAIDTALDPACSSDPIYYRDQRAEMRFSDGDGIGGTQCDVGAYEFCPDTDNDDVCASQDNCPAWTNQAQNLPSWTVPANDPDCDGFNNAREAHVGTDPTDHCNENSGFNNEPDAWPTDFNDSRLTDLSDVVSMGPTFNKLQNDNGYNQRYDLDASNSVVLTDVIIMGPFWLKFCN